MMAVARQKSKKLDAPQSIEEATALCARWSDLATSADEMRAGAELSIAQIEGHRDSFCEPLRQELKIIHEQLSRWWSVAAPAMTEGKRKSIELAGCVIGERTTTPMLKLPKGQTADDLADGIYGNPSLRAYIVVKKALLKPAIIAAIRNIVSPGANGDGLAFAEIGFSVSQREEFFIDRTKRAAAPADPEIMEGDAE
jgi:phage host-nuclease inhibitor protein Gam